MVDGVEYVRKDNPKNEVINWTGEKPIASRMIGKNVIVRNRNEGLNVGTVVLADETGVELKNVRRIWYHKPKDKSLSWYEGVAISGISEDSKVSCTVPRKIMLEDYSMTELTEEAYKSIMNKKPNEQS